MVSELGKQRRAERMAREHAEQTKATMDARSAALETLGDRIGLPLENRGVNLGPPNPPKAGSYTRPTPQPIDIPRPPTHSREEELQLSLEEAENERHMHHGRSSLDQQIPPDDDRPNQELSPRERRLRQMQVDGLPMPPQAIQQRMLRKKPVHPLLLQLRHEFGSGTSEKPTTDIKVADHTWSFMPLTPDLVATAARIADTISKTPTEHVIRSSQAAVALSIVAVDSIPVWMMFGLEPTLEDDVNFPLIPKGPIRRLAAVRLMTELDGLHNQLMSRLQEAYTDKIDTVGVAKAYSEYETTVEYVHWVCSDPDCAQEIQRPRKFDPETNDELPYFCEIHGLEMIDAGTLHHRMEENLNPLL